MTTTARTLLMLKVVIMTNKSRNTNSNETQKAIRYLQLFVFFFTRGGKIDPMMICELFFSGKLRSQWKNGKDDPMMICDKVLFFREA